MPRNLNKLHPFKVHNLIQLVKPVAAHTNSKRTSNLKKKCYCDCACSQYVPSVVKDICKEVLRAIDPKKKRIKAAECSITDGELDRNVNGSSRITRRKTEDTMKDKLGCRLKGGSSLTDASRITTLKLNGAEFLTIPEDKSSKTKRVRLIEEAVGTDGSFYPSPVPVSAKYHKQRKRYMVFNKKKELVKLIADEVKSAIAREKAGSDKLKTIRHPSRKLREAYQSKYNDVVELYKIGTRLESSSDDVKLNDLGRDRNMKLGNNLVPNNKHDKKENPSRKLLKSKTLPGASCGDADPSAKPEKKKILKIAREQRRENSINSKTQKFLQSGILIGTKYDNLSTKYRKRRISNSRESRRENFSTAEKYGGDVKKKDRRLMISQILRGVASDERISCLKSRRPSRYIDREHNGERQSRKRSKSLSKRRCDSSREARRRSSSRTLHPFSDYQFQVMQSRALGKRSTSRKDKGTSTRISEGSRERGGYYDSGKGDRLVLKVKLRKSGTRIAQSKVLPFERSNAPPASGSGTDAE